MVISVMSKLPFDADKPLPHSLCIDRSENHLYRIGLCLTTDRPAYRNAFHQPWLVFSVSATFLAKTLYCIHLEDHSEELLYLGDFSHLIGIRLHFNLACFFYTGFAISLQLTQYYNYFYNIRPNYLSVFDMMSGVRTPKSVGLTNEAVILSITRTTRKVLTFARLATQTSVPTFQITLSFLLFYLLCPAKYMIYGIIGSIHFAWASYYVYNIHIFGVIYFYIICRFLKVKMKAENIRIKTLRPSDLGFGRSLAKAMQSLASIHREISDYNDNFWSMFLLFVWCMYGIVIVLSVYILFLSSMNTYIKIGFSYMTLIIVITFLFIMNTAASVNLITRDSYLCLNSIMSADFASNRLFQKKVELLGALKVSNFIESLGKEYVGFWCWKLFIVNYFRFYEIIMFSMGLFLKVVQMSFQKGQQSSKIQ